MTSERILNETSKMRQMVFLLQLFILFASAIPRVPTSSTEIKAEIAPPASVHEQIHTEGEDPDHDDSLINKAGAIIDGIISKSRDIEEKLHGKPAVSDTQKTAQIEISKSTDDIEKAENENSKEIDVGSEQNEITKELTNSVNTPIDKGIKITHRTNGDVNYPLGQKQSPKTFWEKVLTKATYKTRDVGVKVDGKALIRSKRWDAEYDSNYDWENEGADYNVPQTSQKKETKLMKWAKDWQKHALRFIFAFSFIMMFVCCCCAACKKFFQKLFATIMMHLREWRDVCLNRDPTYRMMRKQADEYGIQLDYEEYKKIKFSYDQSLKKHGHSTVDLSGRA